MSDPSDDIKKASDLYNSWPALKQKEFNSILNATFEKAEYYRQHPEEKEIIIKKARELLDDWKKARKEFIEYHKWWQGRTYSEDEFNKDGELLEIQSKKSRELTFYCMSHPIQETQEILLEAQRILGEEN